MWRVDPSYDAYERCVCDIGFGGTADNCTHCPLNTFMDLSQADRYALPNAAECLPCPPHSSTEDTTGAVSVSSCRCNAGYELNITELWKCEACPDGEVKEANGFGSCIRCPFLYIANAEQTKCDLHTPVVVAFIIAGFFLLFFPSLIFVRRKYRSVKA